MFDKGMLCGEGSRVFVRCLIAARCDCEAVIYTSSKQRDSADND